MQWINASERQPKNWNAVLVRRIGNLYPTTSITLDAYDMPLEDGFEWLDESEDREAIEALQALHDVQNGPPLIKYEKDWNEAMELAQKVLSKQ